MARSVPDRLRDIRDAATDLRRFPEDMETDRWRGFAGLRDLVAHQYFALAPAQLLPIVRDEVPPLLAAVEAELARLAK